MILFLTTDLMMASNAKSHAKENEVTIKLSSSLDETLAGIRENRPHLLLVDLQTPGLDIDGLGEALRDMADSVTPLTVGYAQHVNVELLERGKQAGLDQVLTRGQFDNQIARIIGDTA